MMTISEAEPNKIGNFHTMMHLLKSNMGTGILAMPNAFANAGLLVGTLGIPILGLICTHCMQLLVKNSVQLSEKFGCTSLDYAGAAEIAILHGPIKLKKFAVAARIAVNTMLVLTQFGFCCVYYLFTATSISQVVKNLNGSPISLVWYLLIMLPVMIVLNFIRNLKRLAPASEVANALQIIGYLAIFYFLFRDIPQISSVPLTAELSKLPLFFGTAIFAFEGIGVVLPLKNSMQTPDNFTGYFGVLNVGMFITAASFTVMGFSGFIKYGAYAKSSITFNLTAPIVSEIVILLFATSVFLTYALQFYIPMEFIWPFFKRRFSMDRYSPKKQLAAELILRGLLVFATFVLAAAIPMLNLFISLIGALASSSLVMIFPPIIDLTILYNSDTSRTWAIAIITKNVFIMLFGIIGCCFGTYASINGIVHCMRNNASECYS